MAITTPSPFAPSLVREALNSCPSTWAESVILGGTPSPGSASLMTGKYVSKEVKINLFRKIVRTQRIDRIFKVGLLSKNDTIWIGLFYLYYFIFNIVI